MHKEINMKITKENTDSIYKSAIKEITANFNDIKAQAEGETLYAFGLALLDDFYVEFRCAGNSIESLAKIMQGKDITEDKGIEYYAGYFWRLDEWYYSGKCNVENSSGDLLESIIDEVDDREEYNKVRQEYEQILINALQYCDKNGVFGTGKEREQLVIYVHYADDYADDVISDYSAKILNSENTYNLFKERYNRNSDNLTKVIFNKVENLKDITSSKD